jgi:TrmH family RNA methyltransferase
MGEARRPSRRTAITSLQNERIKAIRALDLRKTRKETGLFVAEGASILVSARDQGILPVTLVVGPDGEATPIARGLIASAERAGCEILEVSAAVLEKLAARDNPQNLIGVFEQRHATLPTAADLQARALWIALEGVRDPGNLGTTVRTADAVGAAGIILAGQTCDPFAREAVRATMGSIFAVPIARTDEAGLRGLMARWPGQTIGTHLDGAIDFRASRLDGPTLLVMGSEGPGLTAATAAACRVLVKIPMAGRLDSLNLAIATALVAYHLKSAEL